MTRSPRWGYLALLCVAFALGALLLTPIGAAGRRATGCKATVARITPAKAYRLWVERQCKEFRKLRAGLGRLPDVSTPEKFAENGQDYADHEEAIDRLLNKMAGQLGNRRAPNKSIEKGIERWIDAFDDWYKENESLVGEIRQGSIDFDTFAQRVVDITLAKLHARDVAKRLGLRACASI